MNNSMKEMIKESIMDKLTENRLNAVEFVHAVVTSLPDRLAPEPEEYDMDTDEFEFDEDDLRIIEKGRTVSVAVSPPKFKDFEFDFEVAGSNVTSLSVLSSVGHSSDESLMKKKFQMNHKDAREIAKIIEKEVL